jgi:hypothetical protein
MSESAEVARRIATELERVSGLRAAARSDPKAAAARQSLRAWQAQRLARTHAALLTTPQYAEAATFFLTDIYGANDPAARDEEVRRVLPAAERLLPAAGLEIVADAIELDALSEDLDAAMVAALGKRATALDAAAYGRAYRKVDRRPDRERQIELIRHLGQALDRLARRPFISTTLAMMRKPAQLAGLGDLQSFLERGYAAFKKMGGADAFLDLVIARERKVLEALFAGDDSALAA